MVWKLFDVAILAAYVGLMWACVARGEYIGAAVIAVVGLIAAGLLRAIWCLIRG